MFVNWDEVQKALSPIKDYKDLCQRLNKSFSYPIVRHSFNFTLPQLITYSGQLLAGDARQRYTEYLAELTRILRDLDQAGVVNLLELIEIVVSPEKFEAFSQQHRISSLDMISLVKYLVYWFIPGEKYLSGLVGDDPDLRQAIKVLGSAAIRTNLEILQAGSTSDGRMVLAETTGLSDVLIMELVNRADFSRLPWASKATISNIIGAGYGSMSELANADPEKLYADFFKYGERIGKNLKLGNEIENSYRIAKIVPRLVQSDTTLSQKSYD